MSSPNTTLLDTILDMVRNAIDGLKAVMVKVEQVVQLVGVSHQETWVDRHSESLTPPVAGASVTSSVYETLGKKDFDVLVYTDQSDATVDIEVSNDLSNWYGYKTGTGTKVVWEGVRIPMSYFRIKVTAGAVDLSLCEIAVASNP